MYLLTSPHTNLLGLYRMPQGYIEADLKMENKVVCTAMEHLVDVGLIDFDEDGDYVWVRYFLATQWVNSDEPQRNEERSAEAQRVFDALPPGPLVDELYEMYSSVLGLKRQQ